MESDFVSVLFEDVTERDVDFLLMDGFVSSPALVQLFAARAGVSATSVVSVQHSKTDPELGETDIEVVLDCVGSRIAFLIEDKIDAPAMSGQARRYFERGEKAVSAGEYERFYVFIVAPGRYLEENIEAQNYPLSVSYEELIKHFLQAGDPSSHFKAEMLRQAIAKQKKGYQVNEDPRVTDFWHKYLDYQRQFFPSLWFRYNGEAKGSFASWLHFNTVIRRLYIDHKTEFGCVDLTFEGYGDRLTELEKCVDPVLGTNKENCFIRRAGKSGVLRIDVPRVDVHLPFEDQLEEVESCFRAIDRLSSIAERLEQHGFTLTPKL